MSEAKLVRVIGRGSNVNVNIDDEAPIDEALKELRSHVFANRALYSSGTVAVSVGRRMLCGAELANIKTLLETETGVTISRFLGEMSTDEAGGPEPADSPTATSGNADSPPESEPWSIAHNDPRLIASKIVSVVRRGTTRSGSPSSEGAGDRNGSGRAQVPKAGVSGTGTGANGSRNGSKITKRQAAGAGPADRGEEALLIKTNCRSGEIISYSGDIVVLADVNPGAQLIADGDIFVYGILRGFAHAGAGGDTKAVIVATGMQAPRLQIGPHVGVAPEGKKGSKPNSDRTKVAYVGRQSVFVTNYTGRFATYRGGTLYEG